MANIVISTHWSDGDVIPFLNIGKYLKNKGHDVTIFTHCVYEERVKKEKINFVPWDTLEEYDELFKDLVNYSDSTVGKEDIQYFRDKHESSSLRIKEYELLKPYCKREDTILIAKNRSSIAALLIAEKLNIPLVWVYMNPYEYESSENFNNINGQKLCEESNELREKMGLKPIESWLAWQCAPKGKIGLWPKWYKNKIVNEQDDIELVGFPLEPLNKDKSFIDEELKNILLETPSPIIISGGSSKKIRKEFYKTAIKACENLERKVIVATRHKELLQDTIPNNVYVFDYIPLYESLAYVSLIIHHGGIGTVSNAINTGVPQLILADYLDRPLNASIVKEIGLGEYIPPLRCNVEVLKENIVKLLNNDYKEKCTKFAEDHAKENTFKNIERIIAEIQDNKKYLIDYEIIKNWGKEKKSNIKDKNESNVNLSNNMKKYLLEKMRKERSVK